MPEISGAMYEIKILKTWKRLARPCNGARIPWIPQRPFKGVTLWIAPDLGKPFYLFGGDVFFLWRRYHLTHMNICVRLHVAIVVRAPDGDK